MNTIIPQCETQAGHIPGLLRVTDLTLSDPAQPFLKLEETSGIPEYLHPLLVVHAYNMLTHEETTFTLTEVYRVWRNRRCSYSDIAKICKAAYQMYVQKLQEQMSDTTDELIISDEEMLDVNEGRTTADTLMKEEESKEEAD